ncbi:MAG: hypothetical protein FD162_2150 [Rhodobacteraceae bacterium]|nr:MAG: hypothetical protein FD162_2150 [Paracoccaceae bacterium]
MIYLVSGATDTEKPFAVYDNAMARGVLSGTDVTAGSDIANMIGPQTYDYWQPITPTGFVAETLNSPEDCDAFCIANHNLHLSNGNLYLQASPDLVAGYTTVFSISNAQIVAGGADPIVVIFPKRTVQRIAFTMTLATVTLPFIGVAMLGQRTVFPGWVQPPYVQMPDAETLDLQTASTLGGHYIDGSVRRKALAQDVQFSPLDRSFVDGGLRTFGKHYNSGKPFFWGGSPLNMPNDVGYVWRSGGELRPALMDGGKYATVKMGLAGYDA